MQHRQIDDFHPDQLVENLELFEQLRSCAETSAAGGLRPRREGGAVLGRRGAAAAAAAQARGATVATDRKLSDFARLTGRQRRRRRAERPRPMTWCAAWSARSSCRRATPARTS